MRSIYIFLIVIALVTGAADIILSYVSGIRRFGLYRSFRHYKERLIPVYNFIPNSLASLIVFVFVTGVSGFLFDLMGLIWFLSLPVSLAAAANVNFIIITIREKISLKINSCVLPGGEDAAELIGTCIEKIAGDGYGKVNFTYKNKNFVKNAVSVNETDIETGEVVLAVYEKDDLYFVEKYSELYDILNHSEIN